MQRWHYYFFPLTLAILLVLALASNGVFDPGDGINHYLIARYSWKHPALFLDHWGKPMYTLLASTFAQCGYQGVVFFNILLHVSTGWLTWKIAEKLKIPFAPLAAPLAIFAPMALPVAMSGLTETLFAFVLLTGIYLVISGRYGMAAILISFLPFVRTEGFFLAPFFGLFFLLRGERIAVLLLATGTVLYSIIGGLYYHNLLWIIDLNPYQGAKDIYGSGSFWHFISLNEFIWGWGMTGLLVMSLIVYVFPKQMKTNAERLELILILGIFIFFLLMHSVFWWKGWFGSLGLHRVMACTMPLAAIMSLRGFQLLTRFVSHKKAQHAILVILIGVQVFLVFRQHPLPMSSSIQEQIIQETSAWLKQEKLEKKKIFSAHPALAFESEKDIYDLNQWQTFYCTCPEVKFNSGELIVWDTHFAKFDANFALELLQQDPRFEELTHFGQMPANKKERPNKFGVWIFRVK
jgi:hypothetical protein